MARSRPHDRFEQLIRAATEVFLASGGFRRAQIGDVAEAMGVAKGTLYLYVESKEALFDLVIRHADHPELEEPELPVKTPEPGATLEYLRRLVAREAAFPALSAAEKRAAPKTTMADEASAIVDEIYDVLGRHRTAIRLIGASAHDLPELAELWFRHTRSGLNRRLERYLARRTAEGFLRPMPDGVAAARLISELVHWFAVMRHFDRHPDRIDDDVAKATVRVAVLRTLLAPEQTP